MEFVYKRYEDMTRDELHDVFWLRNVVFVYGQKITAEPEIDGLDPECSHAMLYADDGRLVGTARVFDRRSPQVVGRVAVHTDLQGQGLGTLLMQHVQDAMGEAPAELHAQAHLEAWYTGLGWTRVGEVYEEAEIPHITMTRGV